jgi:hypothetical protein
VLCLQIAIFSLMKAVDGASSELCSLSFTPIMLSESSALLLQLTANLCKGVKLVIVCVAYG